MATKKKTRKANLAPRNTYNKFYGVWTDSDPTDLEIEKNLKLTSTDLKHFRKALKSVRLLDLNAIRSAAKVGKPQTATAGVSATKKRASSKSVQRKALAHTRTKAEKE